MESMISGWLLHNWQRKLVAVLTAIIIWLFVNHSINETVTIPNVPIRIINLPEDKTIIGLLQNGMLSKRIALSLTGTKEVVEGLEAGDLEVLLDASTADNDNWVVRVTRKNLISLNPAIDLSQHIMQVDHTDFVIKLSRLMTAKIPLVIETPTGNPPQGYEYLDIWPQHLFQTVSGPEEEIQQLKGKELSVTFDLSDVTKIELDAIKNFAHTDEITFPVPKKWKQVFIPFRNVNEELNDPEMKNLSIDFLRKDFLPLQGEIPFQIFYPLDDLEKINSSTYALALSDDIKNKFGVPIFTKSLYAKEVSRRFLDVIRNSIELVIFVVPKTKRKVLSWSVQFINAHELEDTYVSLSIASSTSNKIYQGVFPKKKEELLRQRFRDYMQRFTLYLSNAKKLHLKSTIEGDQIRIVAY